MAGRRALLLVSVGFVGVWAWVESGSPSRPAGPTAGPADEIPIVAVRGRPLAPHEEPLPDGARVRIGSTRYRHPNELTGWEANAVGRYVMTIPIRGGRFTLTDTETGRRVWTEAVDLGAGPASFLSGAASRDGRRLVVWSMFPTGLAAGRLWQVNPDPDRPLTPVATLHLPPGRDVRYVEQAAFTADGNELVLAANNTILRYDAATGGLRSDTPIEGLVLGLSADGARFFSSDGDDPRVVFGRGGFGGLRVTPRFRFRARTPEPEPDRRQSLPRGTVDSPRTEAFTLTVGDTRSGNVVATLTIPREVGEPVSPLNLAPDGRHVSFGFRGDVGVLDVDRQQQVLHVRRTGRRTGGLDLRGAGAEFTADGRHLIVRDGDQKERAFDLGTGREVAGRPWVRQFHDYRGRPFRPDLVSDHGVIARPDPQTPLPPGYAGAVLAYCPDRQLIAVGDAAGRLDVWRADGTWAATLRTGGKGVAAVGFSPDGRWLAACDRDRVVRVWSVGSWRQLDRFQVPADSDWLCPDCLTFSPDGRRLLVSHQDVMALWDIAARAWVWDRPGHLGRYRYVPVFSPDGARVLLFQDSWVDAKTGDEVTDRVPETGEKTLPRPAPRRAPRGSQGSTISADGSLIAAADGRGTLCVWELGSGRLIREFPESGGLRDPDSVLNFSPDGRRLVTCDNAGHAHVWEVASGQLAFTLTYPDGAIRDVRFGIDGRSLITANHREVIVWDLTADPSASADPWADLAGQAPRAEMVRRDLLADPAAAVKFLRARLRPVPPVDPAAVARLVALLDAPAYRDREQAVHGLRTSGRRVLPMLRDATAGSEEGRARLAALMRELQAGPTADERRHIRAVEVLEHLDSPAARALLDELRTGDPGAVLTDEALSARARRR